MLPRGPHRELKTSDCGVLGVARLFFMLGTKVQRQSIVEQPSLGKEAPQTPDRPRGHCVATGCFKQRLTIITVPLAISGGR